MIDHIIPIPKKVCRGQGAFHGAAAVKCAHEPWRQYVQTAADSFSRMFFADFTIGDGGAELVLCPEIEKGQYRIESDETALKVCASEESGLCFGIASLLQLVEYENGGISAECCTIEDWGDKEYRGLMLDLVVWHPLEKVLRLLDVCFFLKTPFVHLHLIDNVACRIPMKAFPKLTHPQYAYSEQDIMTIRRYAAARGLKLIPEFDVPGHARTLVNTYPEVFGNHLPQDADVEGAATEVGFTIRTDDVVCAGSETCRAGLKTIFAELAEMFPESEYIHIGGDEAYIQVWDHCPDCRNYMEENGIADRYELYSDFVAQMAQCVLDLGRTPIVWEGFPRRGSQRIPKETIVIAWESLYNIAPDLLEDGFRIINGSWEPLYIFCNTRKWTKEEIMGWDVCQWRNWWDKSKAYETPIRVEDSDQVWGAQISVWGSNYEMEINSVMENLGAMAERTWNLQRRADDAAYHVMSDKMTRRLSAMIQDR